MRPPPPTTAPPPSCTPARPWRKCLIAARPPPPPSRPNPPQDFNAALPLGRAPEGKAYAPPAYERDGFVHACASLEDLLSVANAFYTGDRRHFYVMQVRPSSLSL